MLGPVTKICARVLGAFRRSNVVNSLGKGEKLMCIVFMHRKKLKVNGYLLNMELQVIFLCF